jgi:hypothetical protein
MYNSRLLVFGSLVCASMPMIETYRHYHSMMHTQLPNKLSLHSRIDNENLKVGWLYNTMQLLK